MAEHSGVVVRKVGGHRVGVKAAERAGGATWTCMPESSIMYVYRCEVTMPRTAKLKRKSFFVDEAAIRRAKKALGARTDAEAVRLSVERVAEMEAFWKFMEKNRGALKRGDFTRP
jgi:hypothetical protein